MYIWWGGFQLHRMEQAIWRNLLSTPSRDSAINVGDGTNGNLLLAQDAIADNDCDHVSSHHPRLYGQAQLVSVWTPQAEHGWYHYEWIQHGFRRKRTCLVNAAEGYSYLLKPYCLCQTYTHPGGWSDTVHVWAIGRSRGKTSSSHNLNVLLTRHRISLLTQRGSLHRSWHQPSLVSGLLSPPIVWLLCSSAYNMNLKRLSIQATIHLLTSSPSLTILLND